MANLIKIKRGTRQQLTTAGGNTTLNQGEPYFITGETVATPAEARLAVGISNTEFITFVKETELKNATLSLQMGTEAATATTVTIGTGTGFSANTATNATYTIRVGPALRDLADTMTGAGTGFLRKDGADNFLLDTNTYLTGNQSISVSGDATGSGTTSIALTLKNTGTAGTYTKVTTDAQGRVSSGTTLSASDIPDLTAVKITDFDTQVRTSTVSQLAIPTTDLAMNSRKITGLADPASAQDAATKAYVDGVAQGLDIKASVRLATAANISSLSGAQTIDGTAVVTGDRILIKNHTTASQNGIWIANTGGAWTRAADANAWTELISAFTFVEEGTANADTSWVSTVNTGGALDTTAITFVQFGAAGTVTAGDGLDSSGNTLFVGAGTGITVNANDVQISATYAGQPSITTLGTIATGTWSATEIAATRGGTGQTTYATGDILYASGTNTLSRLTKPASLDSFLQMTSAGVPSWVSTIDGGTF
jgi:hypothetical protein